MRKSRIISVLVVTLLLTVLNIPITTQVSEVNAAANRSYYRNLLNEQSRSVYDSLYNHYIIDKKYTEDVVKIDFEKNVTGTSESDLQSNLRDVLRKGYYAFYFDHPEIISLYRTFSYRWYTSFYPVYNAYNVSLTVNESYTGVNKQITTFNNNVTAAYNKIKKSLPKKASCETQVYAIHNYICNKITYSNTGNDRKQIAVPAFISPYKGVCESYARSFKVLCDRFGIPCILIEGNVYDKGTGELHEWNYVQMTNKKWYLVDCTWDDQKGDQPSNTYFLKGSSSKGIGGKVIGSYRSPEKYLFTKFPTLQKNAYNGIFSSTLPKTKYKTLIRSGDYIRCSWKAKTKKYGGAHITGYQIRYAPKRNMKHSKIKTIKGYMKGSANFKLNRKYNYFLIRTYRKSHGYTVYGAWN